MSLDFIYMYKFPVQAKELLKNTSLRMQFDFEKALIQNVIHHIIVSADFDQDFRMELYNLTKIPLIKNKERFEFIKSKKIPWRLTPFKKREKNIQGLRV